MGILLWVALVPLAAALLARWVMVETRGRALPPNGGARAQPLEPLRELEAARAP